MKYLQLVLLAAVLGSALAGCGGSQGIGNLPPAYLGPAGRAASARAAAKGDAGEPQAQAGSDSTATVDIDWLVDNLAALVDSVNAPADITVEVPDISDSLAAATQASLPPTEELFDYPVVVNLRVLTWIDYFLGRIHKNFEAGLQRSGRYLSMARRIFKEEGVPQDLVFLAHVESAFKVNALSSARALGLWQFMRGTGKLYGLRCDAYVDERLDPEKATRAAARHLHDLYNRYGDWYLALAAYNAGAGNVDRAIQRTGIRDFWQLSQTRYLVYETRNFVPAILAATIIAKSPGAYGFTEETDPPLAYDTVIVHEPIDLRVVARYSGATLTELERLNTALLLNQTPPLAEKYELRVPAGLGDAFARRVVEIPSEERLLYQHHKVKSGENLAMVAARYGTTVRAVQDANRMGRSTLIRAGQSLLIPGHGAPSRSVRDEFEWSSKEALTHRVRRGDTLSRIAGLYNVPAMAIQTANSLKNPDCLSVGQELTIPVAGKASDPEATDETASDPAPAAAEPVAAPVVVPATRSMLAQNNSEALGRVPSTAHIVAQARLQIGNATATPSAAALINDGPTATRRLGASAPASDPPVTTYRVHRGDTLGKIASRFGVSVSQLRDWNRVRGGNLIYPGQVLRIARPAEAARIAPAAIGAPAREPALQSAPQPARVHIVRRGDSLWKISKRYGVSTSDLMRKNALGASSTLQPGQQIVLH